MAPNDKLISESWKMKGLDQQMQRTIPDTIKPADYIGGANFDVLLDELLFNRMIRLKDLREVPQGNDPGKMYWDGANSKVKIWVNGVNKWVDVVYTSTSTSTTSTSTTSTSTSTTSTSTTSTSTTSSSTSTT